MENDITNFINKYNIKLVLPTGGESWGCEWINCGCCCITENTRFHIKKKCSKLNVKTKQCGVYSNRPIECKLFPFMVIFNENGINLSPSLICPYVLSSTKIKKMLITDILRGEDTRNFLGDLNDNYRRTYSTLNITKKSSNDEINELLKQIMCVNKLDDFEELIFKNNQLDTLETIIKNVTNGPYIQPNYSNDGIPNPLVMNIRLTTKNHIIFKSIIKTEIIKEIEILNNILINGAAQALFKQYIELNLNRQLEFHSLYHIRLQDPNTDLKYAYKSFWITILIQLYIDLLLILLREKSNIIDFPIMREALSMSDSTIASLINTQQIL